MTMVCIELGVYGAIVRGSCKMSFLKRKALGVKKRHTHSFNLSTSLFFLFFSDVLLHLLIILLILLTNHNY
jgi:hypothetical protein